jgi:hypothetical protein
MQRIQQLFSFFLLLLLATACEDVIEIETRSSETQLVVDAWITDESKEQVVRLSLTQPYFDPGGIVPAKGATVIVFSQDSIPYEFKDLKNDGNYVWRPKTPGEKILQVGKQYALYVRYNNEEYFSLSKVNRVPPIDSINYFKQEYPFAPPNDLRQDGYQVDFYARDFPGPNDCYWIRAYRNDTLFNKPSQLTMAYDAGFSPGGAADGLMFILPLRASASPDLYKANDKMKIELYSIPIEAFYFLQLVRTESTSAGIFATAPSNIPTNIQNLDEKNKKKVLGFFAVSAVSSLEAVIDGTKAIPKPFGR